MKRAQGLLLGAALVLAHAAGSAQVKEPMLKGKQVTESALIEALEIDKPEVSAEGGTRGFGVVRPAARARRDSSGGSGGKASLLITFGVDSAELNAEAMRTLDTLARALQSDQLAGFAFRVEGHADPRGGDEVNQQLSQRRAEAVVSYLVVRHGLLAERLAPQGKGSSELMNKGQPLAPENRRVTIVTQRG